MKSMALLVLPFAPMSRQQYRQHALLRYSDNFGASIAVKSIKLDRTFNRCGSTI
jgi:hypothetical protein